MAVTNLDKSQTFDTEAGPVTITGIDLNAPEERCVKGYIRDKTDVRITHTLEYNLNGVVKSGRSALNLDMRNDKEVKLMRFFDETRRRS